MLDLDLGPVPEGVLDLFAVPGDVRPVPGGRGATVVAGDLLLTPDRDPAVQGWLSPVLARLAVAMDERPARSARDLRLAVPVPARDGSWVVEGWAATRYEPGTRVCEDLDVVLAAGRLLHAELAVAVPEPPSGAAPRRDRGAEIERLVFDDADEAIATARRHGGAELADLVADLLATPYDDSRPAQLVHAELGGNVLLDAAGAPVVTGVVPSWRPPLWADALAAVDAVRAGGVPSLLRAWSTPTERGALARAAAHRLLLDGPTARATYAETARHLVD
ncbi:hypothetical protein GCM10009737_09680 [Nocardioides lentus]|uniref:Aminoglycoside phosphotransferase n=1 Tax=Nocardioides lentus TaxID=338077 RepID=A0ABP5ADT4_9ACTN